NSGGNDILVYNASYVQVTAKTITENINTPTGVAFDPAGNLWVANYGPSNGGSNGSVAEYTNGVQDTNNSITNSIRYPNEIAIDHDGNIWVQNSSVNVTVYGQPWAFQPTLMKTIALPFPVYGIAVGYGVFAFGGDTQVTYVGEIDALVDNSVYIYYSPN